MARLSRKVEPQRKRVLTGRSVAAVDPKPQRSIHGQVEGLGNTAWRTERTTVENVGDELWIGVKG